MMNWPLFGFAMHCAALHYTALCCTALHYPVVCCTALHCTVLHCTALYCTVLHCPTLHCAALHYTVQIDGGGCLSSYANDKNCLLPRPSLHYTEHNIENNNTER